jgi:hypothetical protein
LAATADIRRHAPPSGPRPLTYDGKPDLSGVWWSPETVDPGKPEFLPTAIAITKQRHESNGKDSPQAQCLPTGPLRSLDVIETLFRLTEIYEFASRLSQKMSLQGSISISVELLQVKSRILTALEFHRAWWGYYPSAEDNLRHIKEVPVAELIGDSAQLALDAAIWVFHRFQWNDPNQTVLQNDQQKLLTRTLR